MSAFARIDSSPAPAGLADPLETNPRPAPRRLSRPVAGLLLDVGDVLYDATVWQRWLLQLLGRMGLHTQYRPFFRLWRQDYLGDVCCGRRDYWEALRAYLQTVGLSRGQIDQVLAAGHARRREVEDDLRPLPKVAATLAALTGQGIVLAAVDSSPHSSRGLWERLERLQLAPRFAAAFSSLEIGCTAPDGAYYLTPIKALGLEPAEVAFVGHDASELAGAAALGLQTVAFNYDLDAKADAYLDDFQQLPTIAQFLALQRLAG